jgi:hypothetical protein
MAIETVFGDLIDDESQFSWNVKGSFAKELEEFCWELTLLLDFICIGHEHSFAFN